MIGERISCRPPLALTIGAVGAQTAFSKGQDGRGETSSVPEPV